eukprot:919271_1
MRGIFMFATGFISSTTVIMLLGLYYLYTTHLPSLTTFDTYTPIDCHQGTTREFKNIFLDVGANRGDTFFLLLNDSKFFPPTIHRRDIDVYLFEASPIWNDLLYRLYTQYPQIKGVYNGTALWINSTEKLSFWVDQNNHEASSSFHKPRGMTPIIVDCIDVCEWMIHEMHFEINDTVIIKLDVEGAEYKIMEHICHWWMKCLLNGIHGAKKYIRMARSIIIWSEAMHGHNVLHQKGSK